MNDARVWIRKYANTLYWTLVLSDSRLLLCCTAGLRVPTAHAMIGLFIGTWAHGRVKKEIVTCLWTVSRAKVSIPLLSTAISEFVYNKY